MSALIDSYSESNKNVDNVVYSAVSAWYQSITGSGVPLGVCRFFLKKTGNPTGTAVARLYLETHATAFGVDSKPTGAALAVSAPFDVVNLIGTFQLISFFFLTPFTLVNGTHYVVSFEYAGGNVSNCVNIGYDNSSPGHAGNAGYYTTSWVAYAAGDTCFYCYSTTDTEATWFVQTVQDNMEHSVIVDGKVYVPSLRSGAAWTGGLYIYDLASGAELHHYVVNSYSACAPIVSGGYIFFYDHKAKTVQRIRESDGAVTHTLSGLDDIDFESMGWDTVNSRIILPLAAAIRGYNMADLSQAWTNAIASGIYQSGSPLVVGNYIYWKANNGSVLYQLNLADGTTHASKITLGTLTSPYSYVSAIYDPDHDYVYVFGTDAQVHCIKVSDMSLVWSKTVGAGMTTPRIHSTIGYHNGKVFVPCRDETNYKAKIYALDYTNGDILWTNTDPFDDSQDVTSMLLTDDYLIVAGLKYTDLTTGTLYTINQSDGVLDNEKALKYGAACGGVSAASDGKIIVNELGGFTECFTPGYGSDDDSEHYMKNLYHNGYSGNRLMFGTPPGGESFVAWIN